MKKRIFTLALALILCLTLMPMTSFGGGDDPPPWSKASSWAEEDLETAASKGLYPNAFAGVDMTADVDRREFAAVAVAAYRALTNIDPQAPATSPFLDTTDEDVLKAYSAGIVLGVAADRFEPGSLLTREQAAVMLTRVYEQAKATGMELAAPQAAFQTGMGASPKNPFADDADISDWAKDSVYFMAANGIILGTGNNMFSPRAITTEEQAINYASATREQAIIIALRMVQKLGTE